MSHDTENIIFTTAAAFINNSNHPVFLTGKAGTGKTTFLKYILEHTRKNAAVIAPTGVAAINAGGTTIHSFFQLPFGPFVPGMQQAPGGDHVNDKQTLLAKLRLTAERRAVMQELELLIIDEISMVRCDVLDAIDTILRHVRAVHSKPFGGVQVLYIGDMYQLQPVIKDEEWQILKQYYTHPFFFSSQVIAAAAPVYIELKKVYRQTDLAFIDLLNQVRNNEMDEKGYQLLHSRFLPEAAVKNDDGIITLTTHNHTAEAINNDALKSLNGKAFSFKAAIEGDFYEKSFPADEQLQLKIGAQVMFIKNDTEKPRRYFNGKIGIVERIENDKIHVCCTTNATEESIEVKKETWRNIKYTLNKSSQRIEEEELGSFTQYPLRLAWAITIHKSQGLTFENAIIDAGAAFAPGQVYVALSRCTSLEGLTLKSKISYSSLHSDERVVAFAKTQQSGEVQAQLLEAAMLQYQQETMISMIDFTAEEKLFAGLYLFTKENNLGSPVTDWIDRLKQQFDLYATYGARFSVVLDAYFKETVLPEMNAALQDRFAKAAAWFYDALTATKELLLQSPAVTDNRQVASDYTHKLHELFDRVCFRLALLTSCKNGFSMEQYRLQRTGFLKDPFAVNAYAGRAVYIPKDVPHPGLYEILRNKRDELCQQSELAVYMVCSTQTIADMCTYLPQSLKDLGNIKGFGKVKLKQFGHHFINLIKAYALQHHLQDQPAVLPPKKSRKPASSALTTPDTKLLSYDLFMQGKTIDAIAAERNLTRATIETHLLYFVEKGSLEVSRLLSPAKQQRIAATLEVNRGAALSAVKEMLPEFSYNEIKMMAAALSIAAAKD